MKKLGFLIAVIAPYIALADYTYESWLVMTTLPQQARLCDIAGSGLVVNYSETSLVVRITNAWLGDPATNTVVLLRADGSIYDDCPSTNIVFFATTNMHYQAEVENPDDPYREPSVSPFAWEYTSMQTNTLTSTPLTLIGGDRGWFPADADGGQLLNFTSNLVSCVRLSPDIGAYYSLLRNNGGGWSTPGRVAEDTRLSLWMSSRFNGTNMLSRMSVDVGLDAAIRNAAIWRLQAMRND